jgi:hypothetical protein
MINHGERRAAPAIMQQRAKRTSAPAGSSIISSISPDRRMYYSDHDLTDGWLTAEVPWQAERNTRTLLVVTRVFFLRRGTGYGHWSTITNSYVVRLVYSCRRLA